jgi:hypothetical protein
MSLDTLLQEAITTAIHLGGWRTTLKGGLTIEMRVENTCILHLVLSRQYQCPSITEWETVIKYFPWPVSVKPQFDANTITAILTIHPKYIQLPLDLVGHLC